MTVDGALAREPGAMVGPTPRSSGIVNRKAMSRVRLSLPRLYEDETLIVVDKPAGLLTVPSAPGKETEDTARGRVHEYVAKLHPHRRPYVGAVHRLDRDTSGALAFALDAAGARGHARALQLARSDAQVRRDRDARARGARFGGDEGEIDLPVHVDYVAGRRRIAHPGEPSLPAVTRFTVRERFGDAAALVELELRTGRQHQIRLHLAHVGMPVLGDQVYGSSSSRRGSGPKGRGQERAVVSRCSRRSPDASRLAARAPASVDRRRGAGRESAAPGLQAVLDELRRRAPEIAAGRPSVVT